jgi:Lon-like protease
VTSDDPRFSTDRGASMIDASNVSARAAHRGVLALAWIGGVFAVLLALALVAGAFVRLPYVVVGPGPVTSLDDDALRIEGAPTYEHEGEVLFLTVSITRQRPNVYRYLQGRLDRSSDIVGERDFYGEEPSVDHMVLSALLMEQSQISSRVVALEVLGYDVPTTFLGGLVNALTPEGTAHGVLRLGDVIVAVDDEPTPSAQAVGDAIRAREPGDEIEITVDRRDEPFEEARSRRLDVTVGERGDVPAIGVLLSDFVESPDFPVSISLDTHDVTGSSAGLAFTLAIIDAMSPGDLTGGHKVAVTGAIDIGGRVARVGGVKYKAQAARQVGAVLLVVPAEEVAEARAHAGSLDVVGVETIDDALAALAAIGGVVPEVDFVARAAA